MFATPPKAMPLFQVRKCSVHRFSMQDTVTVMRKSSQLDKHPASRAKHVLSSHILRSKGADKTVRGIKAPLLEGAVGLHEEAIEQLVPLLMLLLAIAIASADVSSEANPPGFLGPLAIGMLADF